MILQDQDPLVGVATNGAPMVERFGKGLDLSPAARIGVLCGVMPTDKKPWLYDDR